MFKCASQSHRLYLWRRHIGIALALLYFRRVSTSDILAITTERGCLWVSQCLWFMILIVLKFCLGEEKNILFYYSTLSCSCLKFWGTLQMPCCLHKYFPGPLSPGPLHKLYLQHYCLNLAIWTVDAIISLPDEGNLAQTINIIQG